MRPQINFARSAIFQRFLRELASAEGASIGSLVQGILIDLHPTWRALWDYFQTTGLDPESDPRGWGHFYWPYFAATRSAILGASPPDPQWMPKGWEYPLKEIKKSEGGPFIVKICVRPTRGDHPDLRTLRALAARQPFFCVVEERPIAHAAASIDGGGEISATLHGTMGGFLKDQNGTVYGVTCAHVAQSTGTSVSVVDVGGAILNGAGGVSHTSYGDLVPVQQNQLCNRITTAIQAMNAGAHSPIGAVVDAALITIDSRHAPQPKIKSIGVVDEIFDDTQFGAGQTVELYGTVSHYHSGYVGAYAVVYKVFFPDNQFYCFDHMFEVKTPSRFANITPPLLASKAVTGDSGAWICTPNSTGNGNYAYCGTLVAVDGLDAYACFAAAIRDWAGTKYGLHLQTL